MSDIVDRTTDYLTAGGLFNPELMPAGPARDLLIDCRIEIESLRSRLAEADALLLALRPFVYGLDRIKAIDAHLSRKEGQRCTATLGNAGQCYKPDGHDGQHSLFDPSIPPWKQP